MEIWKDIEGFEGYYQISNEGRVKSLKRVILRDNGSELPVNERILKPRYYTDKHFYVNLCANDKKIHSFSIHQLVAKAFIPNPNGYTIVHHKDHNPVNNNVENLCWIDEAKHKNIHKNNKKRVDLISLVDGEVINSFDSASSAAEALGFSVTLIRKCAAGLIPSYKGFLWRYHTRLGVAE